MDATSLARQTFVRHREPGYLRLDLPPAVRHSEATAALEAGLRRVAGVYRVGVSLPDGRLAVRYDAHACTAAQLGRALKELYGALPEASQRDGSEAGAASPAPPAAAHDAPGEGAHRAAAALHAGVERARAGARQLALRLRASYEQLRTPQGPPGSLQARLQPVLASALSEKAITNFLNDVVAFYLIKAHWELISQRWLKDPIRHRNAWLTVFYLVFLLVRYRKGK